MSEFQMSPPKVGSWDSALLAPVAEINEHMLALLKEMAAAPRPAGERATPRLLSVLREHWRRLDLKAQRQLACCPYLLLDAGFSQPERWQRRLADGVMDAAARGGYFYGYNGTALVRRMLLLAWHLARSNRLMASVTLGLTSAVADTIAAARLKDLEAIAESAPGWIVPRWEQQPIVWQQLLTAACRGQALALRQAQLRGLQLLAGGHSRPWGAAIC
jgi:hypothetical protein